MQYKMKNTAGIVLGATMALGLTAISALAETELVMSSWLPARHHILVGAIKPWAEKIKEVTDGRVSVRVLARPLGAPPAHYDLAAEGVADISYGLHSFTTDDRFFRSRIGQFSFLGDDAVAGSVAFWNVYSGMLDAQAEHEGTKLLGLFVHGPGLLHNNVRNIEKMEDFTGLKIRVPGGYISDLMTDLGATTLFMSSGEVYEKLSRGVIDGVTFPFDTVSAFNLAKHLKYTMKVPGGLYNTTWFLVMNEAKWNDIAPEDQAAIEAISGEAFARSVGAAWNDADAAGLAVAQEAGLEISEAPQKLVNDVAALAATYETRWSKEIANDGFNGKAALKELRAQTGVEY